MRSWILFFPNDAQAVDVPDTAGAQAVKVNFIASPSLRAYAINVADL
jgi:hypothetical protein